MSNEAEEARFRQTGWPGLRARLFHLYFVIRRPMTFGVRACVFDEARRAVFLIRHTYVPGWQFPGGGVERGETAVESLGRELEEEGNIRLTGKPQLKSLHFNSRSSTRDHVAFYLVTAYAQASPKLPDSEIAESGFFALDALPTDTTPATRRRLAELFEGRDASPYW